VTVAKGGSVYRSHLDIDTDIDIDIFGLVVGVVVAGRAKNEESRG
jgi:hypothetical protein